MAHHPRPDHACAPPDDRRRRRPERRRGPLGRDRVGPGERDQGASLEIPIGGMAEALLRAVDRRGLLDEPAQRARSTGQLVEVARRSLRPGRLRRHRKSSANCLRHGRTSPKTPDFSVRSPTRDRGSTSSSGGRCATHSGRAWPRHHRRADQPSSPRRCLRTRCSRHPDAQIL